jgi:CheY-like chemotaxis protein
MLHEVLADNELKGIFVLVVEDNPDARDLIEHVLRRYGASVSAADSARSALRIVENTPPDVLLSDIGLPEMSGYTLLKKIRELELKKRLPTIPAIAMTAFKGVDDLHKSLSAGFQFHLAKPFLLDELIAMVSSLAPTH